MRITYETEDFRRYEPVIAKDKSGTDITMILCEDLDPETGRWEPFYSERTIKGLSQMRSPDGAETRLNHKEVLIMTDQQIEHSRQRLGNGGVEKSSYLGEEGESFFMRTSGKGDFKVVNLISRETFSLIDVFFTSEEEARLFADKRNLRIADYNDSECSASSQ